jgi:protein-disulfide isomerase
MSRLTLALVAALGVVGGALGYSVLNPPQPQTDTAAIRAIVDEVLAAREAQAAAIAPVVANIDPAVLNPMIEQFLLSEPKLLQRMSVALEETLRVEEQSKARTAIANMQDAIYNGPGQVVVGNPDGDVTLVEFFDYNCGYCRNALPDLAALLAEDPNLRVILKEFPILSNESIDAARVGVLVGETDADYWAFHEALFSSRGKVDKAVALAAAQEIGLSPISLEIQMADERVAKSIQTSYQIAQELGITGTPTYIIGNEIIPGAIGLDGLRDRIANMRECGETSCG